MRKQSLITRDLYYFYEKNTGVSHFQVEATTDGRFPVERAAGLLAMHCMVLGHSPGDYVVMVPAENDALKGLTERAEELLQAGHSVRGRVKLTRREEEVLAGIMRGLANKEIAASLNLSESTIKFHVSSLLAKFRVRGRTELVREATRHTAGSMSRLGAALGTYFDELEKRVRANTRPGFVDVIQPSDPQSVTDELGRRAGRGGSRQPKKAFAEYHALLGNNVLQ